MTHSAPLSPRALSLSLSLSLSLLLSLPLALSLGALAGCTMDEGCSVNSQCGRDYLCRDNECRPRCDTYLTCAEGEACVDGACVVPAADYCSLIAPTLAPDSGVYLPCPPTGGAMAGAMSPPMAGAAAGAMSASMAGAQAGALSTPMAGAAAGAQGGAN